MKAVEFIVLLAVIIGLTLIFGFWGFIGGLLVAILRTRGKIKKMAEEKMAEEKQGIIRETKCTCKACGNVWFYGKEESQEGFGEKMQRASDKMINSGRSMQNAGKSMMCCSGCAPAAFIPDRQKVDIKEPRDLNKCPKCGSRAVEKEIVTHQIQNL